MSSVIRNTKIICKENNYNKWKTKEKIKYEARLHENSLQTTGKEKLPKVTSIGTRRKMEKN